jgi:hypothetical protein
VELSVNADKTSMVLFTNNRKLVGFKKPILFGTELQLKTQVEYLGVILDEKLNWNSHIDHRMQKATNAFWQCQRVTETKGCVLDIHFGGETHFDLRCHTVVKKSVPNKCQSKNSTPATPCLYNHSRKLALYSNCSSGGHTDVATSWYLY